MLTLLIASGGSRGEQFGATAPPQTSVTPLEWRPFAINAPLFDAYGSRNRDKKHPKINNVFRLVKRHYLQAGIYPTSYGIA